MMFWGNKTLKRLDIMLTEAIEGKFQEENYDETQLSRLESKWKQYLSYSRMSLEQTREDRENIKSLISDISHQTKTPLANILLYTELLQEQKDVKEIGRMAAQIHEQAAKLEFLIQALVKMSRLETDILEVKPVVQKAAPMVEAALREVFLKAEQKGIDIKTDIMPDETAAYDKKWTTEALYNILDNAVKYSPKGSCITVGMYAYEMYLCVAVSDEGRGIQEKEKAQIFSRFYRGEQVQQQEGLGIGLYLSREILQKQGGYIMVQSKPQKGSCFRMYLPRTDSL